MYAAFDRCMWSALRVPRGNRSKLAANARELPKTHQLSPSLAAAAPALVPPEVEEDDDVDPEDEIIKNAAFSAFPSRHLALSTFPPPREGVAQQLQRLMPALALLRSQPRRLPFRQRLLQHTPVSAHSPCRGGLSLRRCVGHLGCARVSRAGALVRAVNDAQIASRAQASGPFGDAPGSAEARSFLLSFRSRRFKRDHGSQAEDARKVATANSVRRCEVHRRGRKERLRLDYSRRKPSADRPCLSVAFTQEKDAKAPKEEDAAKPKKEKKEKEPEAKKEKNEKKDKQKPPAPKPKRPKLAVRDASDDDSDGSAPAGEKKAGAKKEATAGIRIVKRRAAPRAEPPRSCTTPPEHPSSF